MTRYFDDLFDDLELTDEDIDNMIDEIRSILSR